MEANQPAPAATPAKLEDLCASWLRAKAEEAAANARRLSVEDQIIELTGKPAEGSKTEKVPGFKLKLTGKMTRKFDWTAWPLVRDQIPQEMWPVKQKSELDETGVKWLQEHKPDLYKLLPLEVKPAKTSIEVVPVLIVE